MSYNLFQNVVSRHRIRWRESSLSNSYRSFLSPIPGAVFGQQFPTILSVHLPETAYNSSFRGVDSFLNWGCKRFGQYSF